MEQENNINEEKTQENTKENNNSSNDLKSENKKNDELVKDSSSNSSAKEKDAKIENIGSDNLDTNVNESILKSIGINIQNDYTTKQKISEIQKQMEIDLRNVDKLFQYGMLDSKLGRNLKKNIIQKAFDSIVQTEKSKSIQQNKSNVFEEFSKTSKDFFEYDGRRDVLNYLKNEVSELGINDLSKISEIVQIVEQSAIKRYLAKMSHDKSLKDANEQAKQKLTANAQQSSDGANLSQTFTRAQIAKMTRKEFEKYEKAIMKQLREGKFK